MKIFRQLSNNSIKVTVRKTDVDFNNAVATLREFASNVAPSSWYYDANVWAKSVAQELDYSLETVCAVTALLSPLTEWELNKRRAYRVLVAWKDGQEISVHTKAAMTNVYACLRNQPFKFGVKTGPFYQNILNPDQINPVVVDSLAMSIVLGLGDLPGTYALKDNGLEVVQQVYETVAIEKNFIPSALQAATWEKANALRKNNRNILPQLHEMFAENEVTVTQVVESFKTLKLG